VNVLNGETIEYEANVCLNKEGNTGTRG